jgi:hypothetical protein
MLFDHRVYLTGPRVITVRAPVIELLQLILLATLVLVNWIICLLQLGEWYNYPFPRPRFFRLNLQTKILHRF